MRALLLGGGIALLLSLLGTRYAIRAMEQLGFGQPIRDDGPTSHHTKRGTPTMGGLVVIASTVLGYFGAKLITLTAPSASAYLLLFLLLGAGAIGFLDDFIKVRQQHSAGLPGRAKMIGLSAVALTFGILAVLPALQDDHGQMPASLHLSFIRDFAFALPAVVVVLLIWLIVAGTTNGVNLV